MKKIYLLLLPVLFLWGSCSMDDVLESNGELNLTVIETNNPIKAEPGETVVFQFVASTSKGELSRIEITSEDGIRPVVEDVTFAMVDEDKALSLDSEGYFSREISTVLVKYPLIMPDDESLRGKSLGIKLKVTRNDGTTKVLDQKFEMIRYINNRHGITMTGKNVAWWKSHATLTLLATQDLPTFGYNMIDPLKSWCWGSILFYPFKISRFS